MENLLSIGMFIVGILVGGFLIWLILRTKIQESRDRGKTEGESERATLTERLQGEKSN